MKKNTFLFIIMLCSVYSLYSQSLSIIDIYSLKKLNDLTLVENSLINLGYENIGVISIDEKQNNVYKYVNKTNNNYLKISKFSGIIDGKYSSFMSIYYYITNNDDYDSFIYSIKLCNFKMLSQSIRKKDGKTIQSWSNSIDEAFCMEIGIYFVFIVFDKTEIEVGIL